ncbi:MAG: alpha/beta fold hydrolase [Pelomonas sp.]|nr:alpha/beta fold hydrolase [Roseateles sp.]
MSSRQAPFSQARRLILFHGLASSPKEFGLIQHPLRRLGVRLECPEVPGYSHGTLDPEASWRDWVDAGVKVVQDALRADPSPFVLGGLCTGSMLALAVAARLSEPGLQGLALLSPLVAYDGWGLPWWYRLRPLAFALGISDRFAMSERPPYGLKNERLRQWVRSQMEGEDATMVGPASVQLGVVRESERLSRHAVRRIPGLNLPQLVIHAREDEICRLQSVRSAFAAARPGLLRMDVLDNSYHMITADNDRQQVAQALAEFVMHLPRAQQSAAAATLPHWPAVAVLPGT